ncbi:LysR family transcriptional regulator [Bradyrhizobium sp. STM 3557]|uniref:LysR family transcriptional regulator n=1 Tax=Bradyrhizobium sp. STM 3557 TaxID=578920 RepID=UPI00388D3154
MHRLPTLELDWLRAFVTVADARNFTVAGEAVGATQSAVSVRIRKLEDRLGQRLLERNARHVALTRFGMSFLPDARRLLQLHDDAAVRAIGSARSRSFELAVSDHTAGDLLPKILGPMRELPDGRRLSVVVGRSPELAIAFAGGHYDAVIGRADDFGGEGETIIEDRMVWMTARSFEWEAGQPLPLVLLSAPCTVRDATLTALARHDVPWREAFVGTGVAAIQAAVVAGFGIAALEARNVPPDCVTQGAWLKRLPPLPPTRVVIRAREATATDAQIVRMIASALKQVAPRSRRRAR